MTYFLCASNALNIPVKHIEERKGERKQTANKNERVTDLVVSVSECPVVLIGTGAVWNCVG